ncbi:glycosyltransferase involved in cell wall biosynthesis [Bacillus sp. V-88]|uniref:Glycosyltransferase n=1 Tax=Rossellomorea vietnamensis TaxID=218284 RepID=A0A6I6UQ41_9BACI|nr:glycosyltransferase family 4 protein [Rossellomorea vietnamensis]PRX71758.1 glycosyltransferase involved in cell wall biosynthesis [Bacillus sp. V-88]QHE61371.1 glycosyltransferase [Rossellomorea vietnamensis]SLK24394.1 Glycosyltransferase involved in cell wall bisynthesis [Bacillus sp. V-88]
MNILLATVFPLPGGGIWTFVSNLRKILVRNGHRVDILCTSNQNSKVVILNNNTNIDLNPFRSAVNRKLQRSVPHLVNNPWVYHAEMNRYIFEQGLSSLDLTQYDVIHAQDVISATALSRVKPGNVPLVTSVHGFLTGAIFHQFKSTNISMKNDDIWTTFVLQYYSRLEQIGYEASDVIHTSSHWMKGIIEHEFKIPRSKMETFRYGLELSDYPQIPLSQKSTNKKIILAVSRLVYLKGLHHLIEALSLVETKENWECWILGEGEEERNLKAACEKFNIEKKVTFWGHSSRVKELMRQADMMVMPSLQENQPFAVIEAQLLGLPTIVSNAGGLPEMIENNRNGMIVEKGNSIQLSSSIEYLLNNPASRDRMSQYAMNKGQIMWDVNTLGRNILQLYKTYIQMKQK